MWFLHNLYYTCRQKSKVCDAISVVCDALTQTQDADAICDARRNSWRKTQLVTQDAIHDARRNLCLYKLFGILLIFLFFSGIIKNAPIKEQFSTNLSINFYKNTQYFLLYANCDCNKSSFINWIFRNKNKAKDKKTAFAALYQREL